ncbi:MAG TPA: MFS transporter [Solirubrobacter sp.]|nr:MFS transporter [Solirubrobacter sp.]
MLPIVGALPIFLVAALAHEMGAEFSFGAGALGVTVALHYAVCAVCSIGAGRIVDALGLAAAVRVPSVVAAASCLLIAVAAHSAAAVLALMLVAALGNGLAAPVASGVLHASTTREGLAFGAQQASGPLAPLAAGLALPLVATPLGWRWAFFLTAGLALVVAVARPALGTATVAAAHRRPPAGPRRRSSRAAARLSLAAGLAGAAAMGAAAFVTIYCVDEVGMTGSGAGLVLSTIGIAAAVGRLGTGAFADRHRVDPLRAVAVMLFAGVVGYALLTARTAGLVTVAAVVIGLAGWGWSGALAVALVRILPDAPRAVGSMMAGTFAGAVVGPVAIGVLAEHGRWNAAWVLCAALTAAAGATVAIARRDAGARTGRPPSG